MISEQTATHTPTRALRGQPPRPESRVRLLLAALGMVDAPQSMPGFTALLRTAKRKLANTVAIF
jgi:hypothetical protein